MIVETAPKMILAAPTTYAVSGSKGLISSFSGKLIEGPAFLLEDKISAISLCEAFSLAEVSTSYHSNKIEHQ